MDGELARGLFGMLIDPGADRAELTLDLEPEARADEVRWRLRELFQREPGLTGILLRVDGHDVGISTPARVRAATGVAGGVKEDLGRGDRAGLPGESTQYRAIRFRCTYCSNSAFVSFYDSRDLPVCDEHGVMELQR